MKDIRIGNDVSVVWSLYHDQEPFTLEGLNVALYLKGMYGETKIEDFTIRENQLLWTFLGKEQKGLGKYSLTLVINEGKTGMVTTDTCDFIRLVSCTCNAGGADDAGVHTETIALQSELELAGEFTRIDNALNAESENAVSNAVITAEFGKVKGVTDGLQAQVQQVGNVAGNADAKATQNAKALEGKQDVINDLETIREGASKGATALQEVPEGYATEAWVGEQGFLTEHQDISGLATKEEVANAIAEIEIPSVEGLATEQFVTDEIAKIEIPEIDNLATKEELANVSGSIKTVIEDLLIPENAKESLDTLEEISAWIQSHPEDAALMNAQIVALQESAHTHENKGVLDGITAEKVAAWDAAEANASAYTDTEIAKLSGIYAPKSEFEEVQKKVEDITSTGGEPNVQSDWNTVDEDSDSFIKNKPDLTVYAEKTDLNGLATETWVSAEIAKAQLEGEGVDLSGYATKDDIKGLATKEETEDVKTWVNEQGFLTEHQSLEGLATEQFVTDRISEIEIPSVDGFATEAWVNEQGFLTEHQDITGKQDVIEDLEAIREGASKGATALQEVPEGYATETWVGEQGFLTEHQDITGKQDVIEDLETIRSGAALGATALQRIDYPQLEDNLIDSGFYHSPDGMLYRSYMEDSVQESLNKADSALQSESDPIFLASPAASITTERMQEWDNKAGKVVNHASSDTNVELTPYVTHKWGTISSLTLTFSESTESEYNVVFEASDADFVLSIPQNIRWANSQIPQFEAKKQYEINIKGERALYAVFDAPYIEGTFLEYIENDGVDYILTDIYITKSMSGMRCKSMILTTPSSNVALAGTRNTSSGTDTALFIMWYLTSGRYLYWNGVRISGFGSFEPNVAYTDEHSGDAVSLDCSYPIAIFGVNNQGRVQSGSVFRLYYLELLDSNGNPIVNLRPFKRTYDNAIGLLDKVSGTFYPSNNGNLIGG